MRCFVFLFLLTVGGNAEQVLIGNPGSAASRIVGGTATTIENYPYLVQLLFNNNVICGGNILTTRIVLSAAHCFVDDNGITYSPSYYSVRAGTTYLNSGGERRTASAIIVHERYNSPARDNDIALLILSTRWTYSRAIQPAYIPPQWYQVPNNVTVVHAGWGRTNANINSPSSVLMHVAIRSVDRAECTRRYLQLQATVGGYYPVTENMICAGTDVGGQDACQGDSGGPLVYDGVVVGLTSWGLGCGDPYFPGVNTRVSSYTNWINATATLYSKGSTQHTSSILLSLSLLASMTLLLSRS